MIGIYKITNNINNKIYIGQSVDINRRFKEHKNLKRENSVLHKALEKYGIENFTFEILEECQVEELNDKEIFYIKEFNSLIPNGYNVATGGGNQAHLNKLKSYSDIDKIKYLLRETNLTNKEIGELFNISDQFVSDINNGHAWVDSDTIYPIRPRKKNKCSNCGKQLKWRNKTGLCIKCYNILYKRKRNHSHSHSHSHNYQNRRISREDLKKLIRNKPFTEIGKMFNVSDNAVRKWCIRYNLPKTKKEIKKYTDEEWEKI